MWDLTREVRYIRDMLGEIDAITDELHDLGRSPILFRRLTSMLDLSRQGVLSDESGRDLLQFLMAAEVITQANADELLTYLRINRPSDGRADADDDTGHEQQPCASPPPDLPGDDRPELAASALPADELLQGYGPRAPAPAMPPHSVLPMTEHNRLASACARHQAQSLAYFLPDIIHEQGPPSALARIPANLVTAEDDTLRPGAVLALLARWSHGLDVAVALIEQVQPRAAIRMQDVMGICERMRSLHPDARIMAVVMITSRDTAPPAPLTIACGGVWNAPWITYAIRLHRVSPADLPTLVAQRNVIAALALTLAIDDVVEGPLQSVQRLRSLTGILDDVVVLLPVIMRWSGMTPQDVPRLQQRLHEEGLGALVPAVTPDLVSPPRSGQMPSRMDGAGQD